MKKIYSGSELAVVVLDTPEEIQAVILALESQTVTGPTERALLAEMRAPAPI